MFEVTQRLARIEQLLETILKEIQMSTSQTDQNFANLQAQVAQNTSVEGSAVTLLNGLSQQLAAAIAAQNNGDSQALPALQAQLQSSASALAAAITANTPASNTTTGSATPVSTDPNAASTVQASAVRR